MQVPVVFRLRVDGGTADRFHAKHDGAIIDCSYDHFGRRMATCSTAGEVKVWDLVPVSGTEKWLCKANWKVQIGGGQRAHHFTKMAWAHPEFGQLLVAATTSGAVYVWEEAAASGAPILGGPTDGFVCRCEQLPGDPAGGLCWRLRAELCDTDAAINDVQFAPCQLGLRLATASADGCVRVYETSNVLLLDSWQMQTEFQASSGAGCTSIDWRPAPFPPLTPACLLVGTGGDTDAAAKPSTGGTATIWVCHEALSRWVPLASVPTTSGTAVVDVAWAPNMGRADELLATVAGDVISIWRIALAPELLLAALTGDARPEVHAVVSVEHKQVWKAEWNFTGTTLASSGSQPAFRMWTPTFDGSWISLESGQS
eukprot:jgi/Mesvir1/6064/Mv00795-RA.1